MRWTELFSGQPNQRRQVRIVALAWIAVDTRADPGLDSNLLINSLSAYNFMCWLDNYQVPVPPNAASLMPPKPRIFFPKVTP